MTAELSAITSDLRRARRSTPERIDVARRAATRSRLIGDGVTEPTANGWIAAWEAKAAQDGLERGSAYWELAGSGSPSSERRVASRTN